MCGLESPCGSKAPDVEPPQAQFFENQEWLNAESAAQYLVISIGALRNMTSNGQVIHYKLGRRVRYRINDLRTLLLQNRRGRIKNGN